MLVNIKWLRELVDLKGISNEEIINRISLYSIEIENVYQISTATHLVVGYVEECIKHPDSDHLHVCQVQTGKESLQIVCGAPNINQGQTVIVAKVGALLPGNFEIKQTMIRGVQSNGMICSLQEIGIEKKYVEERYQTGTYWFEEPIEPGTNALEALELKDEIIELGITPNRADLLSMLGVAYEIAAIFGRSMKPMKYAIPELTKDQIKNLSVKVESEDCILYLAQKIQNVVVKPSPMWLVSRLIAFGIRPINNVVDITNYILALFGQPLHAFDADCLGNTIVVRKAKPDENMITLDEVKRTLIEEDLLITDGKKGIAIAGVMGGLETEVSKGTQNIILEAAVFSQQTVRQTSSRLQLRSESSMRFERGVDPNRTMYALAFANTLFKELADATIRESAVYVGTLQIDAKNVMLDKVLLDGYLGIEIPKENVTTIFKNLQFDVQETQRGWNVLVPSRRRDIEISADLIEEVARIYGYHRLINTLPGGEFIGGYTERQKKVRKIKQIMMGLGLQEIISYSLINKKQNEIFLGLMDSKKDEVELLMPISSDRSVLRKNMLSSMVEQMKYQFARNIEDLGFFEVGKVYSKQGEIFLEELSLSIGLSGVLEKTPWVHPYQAVDFYVLKGMIEKVFQEFNVHIDVRACSFESQQIHPKRCAEIYVNDERIGYFGALHPQYAKEQEVKDVYVAEIRLEALLKEDDSIVSFKPLSKVLNMQRDLAVVLKKETSADKVIKAIQQLRIPLLSKIEIFDVYVGVNVKEDEKSIALRCTFSSYEPMTEELIQNHINQIIAQLEVECGAILRSL